MKVSEKWDIIERLEKAEIFVEKDLEVLERLSKDRNEAIRESVTDVLFNIHSDRSEKILLGMLNDKSGGVRSSACMCLSNSNKVNTLELLKKYATEDDYYLVSGLAIHSIALIAIRIVSDPGTLIQFFEHGLQNENEAWVRAHYYFGLYKIGAEKYLYDLLADLNNDDKDIVFTANLLLELADKNSIDAIKASFNEILNNPEMKKYISFMKENIDILNKKDI